MRVYSTPESASEEFRRAVRSPSQRVVSRAAVMLDGVELADMLIESGSVSCDARRAVLRSVELTVAPDDRVWEMLKTFGAEIQVWRGLKLANTEELVSLGVFVVDSDILRNSKGVITVSGGDRSRRIARNRLVDPYQIAAGVDVGTALATFAANRYPGVQVGFTTLGRVSSASVVFQGGSESDPWKDAKEYAAAHGYDLYFDGGGVLQMRPTPDPATTPASATYYPGEMSLVLTHSEMAAMGDVYNGVVASGEGSGVADAVKAEAWDDDPLSPTYRFGPLGQIPFFYSSPLLTTYADCLNAARTRLASLRGRAEGISWSLIVDPTRQAQDVIEFRDAVTKRYVLDEVRIPLRVSDSMTASARETRVM